MLSKEQFISKISNPHSINESDTVALKEICNQSPYFVTAQLLLLKGLKNIDSINYENQLHTTAAYVQSREMLYHLLMKEALQENIKTAEEVIETGQIETTTPVTQVDEQEKGDDEPIQTNEVVSDLEQQILEEALATSLAYDIEKSYSEVDKTEEIEKEEKKGIEEPKGTKQTLNKNERTSFTSWLKQLNESETEDLEVKKDKKESEEDIISRFIKNEPKIGEPKKEFFSPENIARMSLVENSDFVTETLAKIYAKQGNIPKAISAFQKLSLKYPEKSTYFAAQIKNLEEQLKK